MNEVKETAIALRNEILRSKEITTQADISDVFISAEFIISSLAFLIGPIADMEQAYRKLIAEGIKDGSHAKAEAMAKASDEYKEWRKYVGLYELGHEQVMLLKKFRDDLQREYQRSS